MMDSGRPGLNELWNVPEQESDIDAILESGLHIIYKHSFSCATCIFTKTRVEQVMKEQPENAHFHFVDVRQQRSLSNRITDLTGVRHESPQLLIVSDGDVVWHASHGAIEESKIYKALKK
jgi:bacillithiol system protein YtxJ